jgi:hypothetical protein
VKIRSKNLVLKEKIGGSDPKTVKKQEITVEMVKIKVIQNPQ